MRLLLIFLLAMVPPIYARLIDDGQPGATGVTGATGPTGPTGPTGGTGASGAAQLSSTNTWTAQQTFLNTLSISTSLVVTGNITASTAVLTYVTATSGTFSSMVTASSFNAVGSAYLMNGVEVINHLGEYTGSISSTVETAIFSTLLATTNTWTTQQTFLNQVTLSSVTITGQASDSYMLQVLPTKPDTIGLYVSTYGNVNMGQDPTGGTTRKRTRFNVTAGLPDVQPYSYAAMFTSQASSTFNIVHNMGFYLRTDFAPTRNINALINLESNTDISQALYQINGITDASFSVDINTGIFISAKGANIRVHNNNTDLQPYPASIMGLNIDMTTLNHLDPLITHYGIKIENMGMGAGLTYPFWSDSVTPVVMDSSGNVSAASFNPSATGVVWYDLTTTTTDPVAVLTPLINGVAPALLASTNTWSAQQTFLNSVIISTSLGIGVTNPTGLFQVGGRSLTVLVGGNVGIGLTNPTYPFQVNGAIYASNYIATGNSIRAPFWLGESFYFRNGANTVTWMTLKTGGNVGIGATDPVTLLDVNGNAQFGSGVTKSTFSATGALTLDPAAPLRMGVRTMSQFDAITPALGDSYLCSNCTVPYDLCTATAATPSGFRATIYSAISTAVPGTLVPHGCGVGQ